MAALAAVATEEARDAAFPLLFLVSDYLTHDLDQMMPPCRLRWSRRLGRPLMKMYSHRTDGDEIGVAYIEELHPYETLLNGIQTRMTGYPQWVTVRSRDVREYNRRGLWNVTILDDDYEDRPFMEAWERRYGVAWPFIARWTEHPALAGLCQAYHRFSEEVRQHSFRQDCEYPEFPGAWDY
jgi:hypothetical protein